MNVVDEYHKLAEICSKVDYGDMKIVRANNRAVDKMYKIVGQAAKAGDQKLAELIKLLDDPISAPWIAHQLVEKAKISEEIKLRCFKIIQRLAENGDSLTRRGELWWLKEHGYSGE